MFLFFLRMIKCSKYLDNAYVIESADNIDLHISMSNDIVRMKEMYEIPPTYESSDVITFDEYGLNFKIKFGDRILCKKPKDPGIVGCSNADTDDNSLWSIKETPKGTVFKTGRFCLMKTDMDSREATKGYYLNARECEDKKDQYFRIKKIPPSLLGDTKFSAEHPFFKNPYHHEEFIHDGRRACRYYDNRNRYHHGNYYDNYSDSDY